jgi:hypothetical protein
LNGALAVVIVIGVVISLWVGLGLISTTIDRGVDFLGWAIGSAFRPSAPQAHPQPQGELTLARPSEEVRGQLTATGALDASNGCLTTSSGVLVQIIVASEPARLICRWNPAVTDKPTQIMGDVLRAVRQVDAGAHVVL